jgi:hypothetical protein
VDLGCCWMLFCTIEKGSTGPRLKNVMEGF